MILRRRIFTLLVLLAPRMLPAQLYHIRTLSEPEIQQTYIVLLHDACRFAGHDWHASAFDPQAGYWGDGVSRGNEGIRTVASMLFACATVLKYDAALSADERQDFLAKSSAALRYAVATHITGGQKCPDGKSWGATEKFGAESWQSGMWSGTLAIGAWLIWDHLDPALQQALERVAAWEDDILSRREPPTGLRGDTKAEENGWEVPALVLGELMFPRNPHAPAWHQAAIQYMMNILSIEADLHDTSLVDGRPVNQWVRGANLQPDFTLENHNIFHPSYVACSSYFLTQAALYYTYAKRPVPQAAAHHLLDTWRMFQTILLPWGEAAYPQGMDWELHGLPYFNLFGALATRQHDAFAARMEQTSLQYLRAWQTMCHGDLTPPGSRLGIARHAVNAEQASYGLLAHEVFGPAAREMTARAAAAEEQGVREYLYVGFIAHRTLEKFASFSWKNKIMGVLIPIGEGHEENPDFTVPIPDGFIGSFELDPAADRKLAVVEHSWKKNADGFETSGTLLAAGGRLKQTLKMTSIGSRTVVYEDRVVAVSDVTVRTERGVPLGVENDSITAGTRVVISRDGQTKFDWQEPRPLTALSGPWANVDGRMGIVMIAGSGMAYAQASDYSRSLAVRADILYGSYSDRPRHFKAGEEVARRIAIVFVEVTPEETSALARFCKIEKAPGGEILRWKLPGGKIAEVPLL